MCCRDSHHICLGYIFFSTISETESCIRHREIQMLFLEIVLQPKQAGKRSKVAKARQRKN